MKKLTKAHDASENDSVLGRLRGKDLNTMIENKGIPWDLFFKNKTLRTKFIETLTVQSTKLGQATQSVRGVPIGERAIFFTSEMPKGAEQAIIDIGKAIGDNYPIILFTEQQLDKLLGF